MKTTRGTKHAIREAAQFGANAMKARARRARPDCHRVLSLPLAPARMPAHRGSKKPGRANGLMAGARTVNKLSNSSWFAGSGEPLRNGPSRVKIQHCVWGEL